MAKHSAVERMRSLFPQITDHAKRYFVDDAPIIGDNEYDELVREFNDLADRHPELMGEFELAQRPVPIHEPTGETLAAVELTIPMLSLKKVHGMQDVHRFLGGFKNFTTFVYEDKIDGLALELRYRPREGALVIQQMTTRGAGMVGEDVTHSFGLFFPGQIPAKLEWNEEKLGPLPEEFLVRGEAYISIPRFEQLNELYDKKKSTPRNAVAGWVRSSYENQDQRVWEQLLFSAYWVNIDLGGYDYVEQRERLIGLGFNLPELRTLELVERNYRSTSTPVDGIVIKVNDFEERKRVGETAKYPNWAVAYKFPNEEAQSPMEDVEWNTSRFGRVVPTGKYQTVIIGGVKCNRASLDNYGSFMERGLCVGDVVSVTRNNDVIPRINHVIEHADGPLLEAPTECPSCSALLEVVVGPSSSDLVCNNVSGCPAQLTRRCVNLVDKFGLDIEGLGPVILADLVDRGYIKIPADIFRLKESAKAFMPEYVWENIKVGRWQPLHRFIKAIGLPDIGIVLAKRITNAAPDWSDAASPFALQRNLSTVLSDPRFLMSIKGIGSGTAMKVVNAFNDPSFEENFDELLELLVLDSKHIPENEMRVCVTGSLTGSRDEMIDYFANNDIELTDKLTKDCKFMIIGQKPGKAKLLKATELGINTLDMTDYSSIDKLIEAIKGSV